MARIARRWERSANSSMSCRVIPHFCAMSCAPWNWLTGASPYRARQPAEPAYGPSSSPSGCAACREAKAMGIIDMFWVPPATTRSWVPDRTPCAAKCTACCEDPHWRSTVTPGTSSGRPAASQAVRAMSPACGPTVSRQPNTTSSTAAGSTPDRSISAFRTCAPRSAGWTADRPPPRRPTGVRTASTM